MTPEEQSIVQRVLAAVETVREGSVVTRVLVRAELLRECSECGDPHMEEGTLCAGCRGAAIRERAARGEPELSL